MPLLDGHKDYAAAKSAFLSGRGKSSTKVSVKRHCIVDHPKRKFTEREIILLVAHANGSVEKNLGHSAIPGTVMFKCKDSDEDLCEFAIKIYYESKSGNHIIVVHAFRRDKT